MTPPPPAHDYSERALEDATLALFGDLGWETGDLYGEWTDDGSGEGRRSRNEVVLVRRLRVALARLNPSLNDAAFDQAVDALTRNRGAMIPVNANREVYGLLKDGVSVEVADENGGVTVERVRLIDWRAPENNDFFMASQFWVQGAMYRRRCDLIGFVNGVPLLFMELKASHNALEAAYDDNLTDYRDSIPQLFTFNGLLALSNGSKSVMGGTFAPWEHFFEWPRIDDEGETGAASLETLIRGAATPERLLDMVENFTLFEEVQGGLVKKIAKNHQYLGVNKAITKMADVRERPGDEAGKLGVFWHTQGSGKSLSMVFFTQKILRTIPGAWTFVIVTDRDELDRQIYKTFAATGAVTETEAHARSGAHLKQLLSEDHRYVFTLIQKFGVTDNAVFPRLSERADIVVITDEAHRSQYDTLALNMRLALPNAAFMGFTGTPLIAGEEKTREVFGNYVSIYDFRRSIADKATVPLFYENRIPQMHLTNEQLSEDLEQLLDDAALDDEQERKVQRVFAHEYHLITRDERLEIIAKDLVLHFTGRDHYGKAMVVCIDKATALRMYEKVQKHWKAHLAGLKKQRESLSGERREELTKTIDWMAETDMAVIVSQGLNEAAEMAKKSLNITPHRKRMVEGAIDENFKDPCDPLRIVFVCAMWITGFDVPSCSTIYLDKPMKNHTLMQTIARANRRFPGKEAGLIVDYVGVFRKLQEALAIYGGTTNDDGNQPIKDKSELLAHLRHLTAAAMAFLVAHGVDADEIKAAAVLDKPRKLDDAVEKLIGSDTIKKDFLGMERVVSRVFRAVLPDPSVQEITEDKILLSVLAKKIKSLAEPVDISHLMDQVEDLLDRSVGPVPYVIKEPGADNLFALNQIDFEKLKDRFAKGRKRTEAEKLRAFLGNKLVRMTRMNPTRADFLERFERLIEKYNAGSLNIESFFAELMRLTQDLSEEDQRAMRENLTEEELALFDILTKPEPELTKGQRAQVKKVCHTLLKTLKTEKLVLDWRSRSQTKGAVRQAIEITLNEGLPDIYGRPLYEAKCDAVFEHVFTAYDGPVADIYAMQ